MAAARMPAATGRNQLNFENSLIPVQSHSSRRARPNLSKFCKKTKMCAFYVRDACKRGDQCTFAHDEKEVSSAPDLSKTKLCPRMQKYGECPKGDECMFAHYQQELRILDVDEYGPCSPSQLMSAANMSSTLCPLSTTPAARQTTAASQSSKVEPFASASPPALMTFGEMVMHLTSIFTTVFASKPDVAANVGVPADVLAMATTQKAWADARRGPHERLSFQDVLRWCSKEAAVVLHAQPLHSSLPKQRELDTATFTRLSTGAPSEDSDSWSQSTESNVSSGEQGSTASWPLGQQFARKHEEHAGRTWNSVEILVQNTFIHVVGTADDVDEADASPASRRARSTPVCRGGRS